jgi:hypothetical protein
MRGEVGAPHLPRQPLAMDDPDAEDEDAHDEVRALDQDLTHTRRPDEAQRQRELKLAARPVGVGIEDEETADALRVGDRPGGTDRSTPVARYHHRVMLQGTGSGLCRAAQGPST